MKSTENTQADILNKKLGYEKKQETKGFFIFWENKDDLILNKR
jgi:hypothetical protein